MIDWLTIVIALVIIASLIGFFGFLAWKLNESDSLTWGKTDDHHHSLVDSTSEKKKGHDQGKKKRKEQKKPKRDTKDDETKQQNQSKEPSTQTSEGTDDESEQDSSSAQRTATDLSSKARKRNKNKGTTVVSGPTEKNSNATTRVPPATHPKLATKEEVGTTTTTTKQTTKLQGKPSSAPTATTMKKTSAPAVPREQMMDEEQPFTVVGANRNKTGSSNPTTKTIVNTSTPTVASQPEPLVQRPQASQKETTTTTSQVNNVPPPPPTMKAPTVPTKIADLVKVLPSSQVVVTELMSALDAFALSSDELDLIMHKIANKQSVLKQDWSKLQYGKKVDPQAHIGQAMDDSNKTYQEDLKNNSGKRIKELTEELHNEKRRNNDLLKDKTEKEREIQILHAQLDSIQPKQFSSQQQQQQQQESVNSDAGQVQQRVMQEQIRKLSLQNADWEKKSKRFEGLVEETQKQKDQLIHTNEQLTQSLDKLQKEFQQHKEKYHQLENNHQDEMKQFQDRLEQLEKDNEQLRREEIVHIEPNTTTDVQTMTLTNEEREQFENEIEIFKQEQQMWHERERQYEQTKQQIMTELDESKKKIHELQNQVQTVENESNEKNTQLEGLRVELSELKRKYETTIQQSEEHRRHLLVELLPHDLHQQISSDNHDFDQWFSSYRNVFQSHWELTNRQWEEQNATLKQENEQLHKNMTDIGNQLKEIEQTVQNKEESLFIELKNKDEKMATILNENEQLTGEFQRLRTEFERVQSAYETSLNEVHALKVQLDERFLVAANTPPIVTDESFEMIKQSPTSLSPIVIDIRAEQFNDLIRSSKEALENQDSLTQQLDRHLDDMHRGAGTGEISTSNVDQSNASSSNQQ